jgi:hypothetical protein
MLVGVLASVANIAKEKADALFTDLGSAAYDKQGC